jgi:hypothetical protein
MKTIKKNNEIRRVNDDLAYTMTHSDGWSYCPKSEFKKLAKAVK